MKKTENKIKLKTAKERKKYRCHSCYLVLSRNNKAEQTNERLRIVTLAMHSPQKETDLASPMRCL